MPIAIRAFAWIAFAALPQARLRGEHLETHLRTPERLTPAQVDRYVKARGYAP